MEAPANASLGSYEAYIQKLETLRRGVLPGEGQAVRVVCEGILNGGGGRAGVVKHQIVVHISLHLDSWGDAFQLLSRGLIHNGKVDLAERKCQAGPDADTRFL